jgi:hypothetical protein
MLIYFITLFIVILAVHMAGKTKSQIRISRLFLFSGFAAMVLIAGLRNRSVGTDTGNYVRSFSSIWTFDDALAYGNKYGEYGFWLLNWCVHIISDEYMALLMAIALIVVGCYQRAIILYSRNWTISFFVFIAMGFYTFFFNGARQGIACAIYALAIGPLLERKLRAYVGYVLLAGLFHKTAIMMLPVYFIFDTTNTTRKNVLIILIGIAVAAMFQGIVGLGAQIDARYASYGTAGEGGGYLIIGLTAVLGVFFFMFKKHVNMERERYELYLNMFFFGAVISVVSALLSVNPSGFLRFSMYFNVSAIFLWPIIYKNLISRSSRMLFGYLFSTCYLVLFYLTTERFSNLIPYTFNPAISDLLMFGGQ